MKLIADSGSTKTDWCVVDGGEMVCRLGGQGINPYQQGEDVIADIVMEEPASQLDDAKRITEIEFYGAGCRGEKIAVVEGVLRRTFVNAGRVEVCSDMLGAARALFGSEEGIACILGTGANSCLYDGDRITANVPPLGYILGDEGSGAAMGRRFLSDYLKNLAPKELSDAFYEKFKATPDEIMDSIYNHPFPNRSLSTFSYFLKDHLDNKYAFNLVYEELMRFFQRNIIQYDYKSYPVYFMGNLAYTYADILDLVAKDFGLNIEKTEKSPMMGLIEYHSIYG